MSHFLADTHAHLADPSLFPTVSEVVDRALDAGVDRILAVGIDFTTSRLCVDLADRLAGVFAAVGVHPQNAGEITASIADIRRLAEHPKVVAIGEIGLDYFRATIPPDIQRAGFISQLELAAELRRPVVVHNREADQDVLACITAVPRPASLAGRAGVLHCFCGDVGLAGLAGELGFRVSFAGNLTYKKSVGMRQAAAEVPLDWIMVETDSPYLSPDGFRGRTNEPERVTLVAAQLARTRGVTLDQIAARTSANARDLFEWP